MNLQNHKIIELYIGIGRYSKKKRLLGIGIKQTIQTLTKLMKVMKKGL